MIDQLTAAAIDLRDRLVRCDSRLVLAESCTGGRVAGALAGLPGISSRLCGSFVVYRNDSKTSWLGIPAEVLASPGPGPVSETTTRLLAGAALDRTNEADFSLAVTGDLGPGAPLQTDGMIFVAWQARTGGSLRQSAIKLQSDRPRNADDIAGRMSRLDEATLSVLQFAVQTFDTA